LFSDSRSHASALPLIFSLSLHDALPICPSLKYSLAGSALIFTKGSTAIVFDCQAAGSTCAVGPGRRPAAGGRKLKRGTYCPRGRSEARRVGEGSAPSVGTKAAGPGARGV